jgi:ribokinase
MGIVVVLGSLITDMVARAPRLPFAGESLPGDDFATFLGGKGINQAITARRMGAHVTLIGRVGTDAFGDTFFPVLHEEEIDSTYVERDDATGTGVSLVVIAEDSGQNFIVAIPRANMAVSAHSVETALHFASQEKEPSDELMVFLCQCETSRVSYAVGLRLARELGMTTILNAAPVPREPLSDDLLSCVDILILNEIEASSLAQIPIRSIEHAREAAAVLLRHGLKHVLITLGADGCLWSTCKEGSMTPQPLHIHQIIPPFPANAIDTTAAGDTFCGALAASLADKIPMEEALRRASAASAITVTRKGAIAALPTVSEVEALLRNGTSPLPATGQDGDRRS